MKKHYDSTFYNNQREGSLRSAEVVVPHIIDLLQPRSVIDVGCGVGTWLSVFQKQGVSEILGIDGHHVEKDKLYIENFIAMDLEGDWEIKRKFDLAMSLEVAEHLTVPAGDYLVKVLTRLAPVVFFSAAIPFQEGSNHINEQWQSYWATRFANLGYIAIDAIRPRIWNEPGVEPWYCQNSFLYVDKSYLCSAENLKSQVANVNYIDYVHPGIYKRFNNLDYMSGKRLVLEIYNRLLRRAMRLIK